MTDLIVIGAGVAGLVAARDAARAGLKVLAIEARDRPGGRIYSVVEAGWPAPVELGAEFIHGGDDAWWEFLNANGIETAVVPERHWLYNRGRLQPVHDARERINRVMRQIDLPAGASFDDFLSANGSTLDDVDRLLARSYVEGFHAAPPGQMSAQTLRAAGEEKIEPQHRVVGGYGRVIQALERELHEAGGEILPGSPVASVRWKTGAAEAIVPGRNGQPAWAFRARAAIVTLPLGVLRTAPGEEGSLRFDPPLDDKRALWERLRPAKVVRIVLRFSDNNSFSTWLHAAVGDDAQNGGFIHSVGMPVPVWWSTANPCVVVGWAGGPAANALGSVAPSEILDRALRSFAALVGTLEKDVRAALLDWCMHDWTEDPYSRGAYSFATAGLENAPARLREPVGDTLFFAGEATADAGNGGTVHGAFASGLRAAHEAVGVLGGSVPSRSTAS